jgi:hypothetical protein
MSAGARDRLAVRIGIATGLVVVGDLHGEGAAKEEAVTGETPNLASRLQQVAEPDTVVIADSTRRLVGDLFELVALGSLQLKGFAEAVQAWRVIGEGRAESRFEALHGAHVTPLVGRSEELHLMLSRWRLAQGRAGQVVLISGEPGIGKSRLVLALRERLQDEPITLVGSSERLDLQLTTAPKGDSHVLNRFSAKRAMNCPATQSCCLLTCSDFQAQRPARCQTWLRSKGRCISSVR